MTHLEIDHTAYQKRILHQELIMVEHTLINNQVEDTSILNNNNKGGMMNHKNK